MKYMTSGDIHRMFKQEDEGTIIHYSEPKTKR